MLKSKKLWSTPLSNCLRILWANEDSRSVQNQSQFLILMAHYYLDKNRYKPTYPFGEEQFKASLKLDAKSQNLSVVVVQICASQIKVRRNHLWVLPKADSDSLGFEMGPEALLSNNLPCDVNAVGLFVSPFRYFNLPVYLQKLGKWDDILDTLSLFYHYLLLLSCHSSHPHFSKFWFHIYLWTIKSRVR